MAVPLLDPIACSAMVVGSASWRRSVAYRPEGRYDPGLHLCRRAMKIAVVTPYHQESDDLLRQCHESVLHQTRECHHILVADGYPRALFDAPPRTLHLALPFENADNGNTPRALGGILADRYGFDAIAYLDADNWYDADHLDAMVAAHQQSGAPLIACKRQFHDLDGAALDFREREEEVHRHVDTSCWLLCRPAFGLLTRWLMPKVLSPVCDRIFFHAAIRAGLPITAASCRSVHFRTRYALHFEAAGRAVPAGAKVIDAAVREAHAFLASDTGAAAFKAALGFSLDRL